MDAWRKPCYPLDMVLLRHFLVICALAMVPSPGEAQIDLRKTDLYLWIESNERTWVNVRRIQRTLQRLGYRPGIADGVFGPRTQQAIAAWQTASGLPVSGLGLPPGAIPEALRKRCGDGVVGKLGGTVRASGGACY